MRQNLEHYNEEHLLRQKEAEAKAEKAEKPKKTTKKTSKKAAKAE